MQVKNLSFRHHKQAPYFFKDLSLHLQKGLLHALHGKNGVGKSQLLHILSKKVSKEVVISGEIIAEGVELVNQQFDHAIADRFTFLENLQFGQLGVFPSPFSSLHSSNLPFLQDESICALLKKFHIDLAIPAHKLSGGQRQILALLMKLQRETKILLLDEPTSALDEENATMVFEFLKTLQGTTVFVVCHDETLLQRYTTGTHFHMKMDSQGIRRLFT